MNHNVKPGEIERTRLQVIDGKRKIRAGRMDAVGMNQHVRSCVLRVALDDTDLRIDTPRRAAQVARVSEAQLLAVVRQHVRDLNTKIYELKQLIDPPPGGPSAMMPSGFGGGLFTGGRKAA
jgi:hypothetical protein